MNTLTRIMIVTFVLVALYLLVRNSAPYKAIIGFLSNRFAQAYGALVKGAQ